MINLKSLRTVASNTSLTGSLSAASSMYHARRSSSSFLWVGALRSPPPQQHAASQDIDRRPSGTAMDSDDGGGDGQGNRSIELSTRFNLLQREPACVYIYITCIGRSQILQREPESDELGRYVRAFVYRPAAMSVHIYTYICGQSIICTIEIADTLDLDGRVIQAATTARLLRLRLRRRRRRSKRKRGRSEGRHGGVGGGRRPRKETAGTPAPRGGSTAGDGGGHALGPRGRVFHPGGRGDSEG